MYKVYSINNPEIFALWSYSSASQECLWHYKPKCDIFSIGYMKYLFNKFGVKLSIITALNNIAKQPDGTYGLIFEDDFLVDKDFYKHLETVLSSVPRDFDALKLSITARDLDKGYRKCRFGTNLVSLLLRLYTSYKDVDWIMYHNVFDIRPAITYGNHGFLVGADGARKIVNWYKTHLSFHQATDTELWQMMGNIDGNIKNYLLCKEVPVILDDVEKISFNTSNV